MKKIWMGLAAVVLVMTLGVTGALAAGRQGQGLRYTDTDGDGVCDYYGTNCGAGFADSDGDGVCDHYGTGVGGHHGGGHGGCWNR